MFSKVWKVFKEVAIGILLVLSLWLVVNGALKESKGHFEFGNLMDFFNTLGTLGTLLVAYLAYKNAPKWLHQKQEEDGYTLLKELILNDYYNFFLSWHSANSKLTMLGYNLRFIGRNFRDYVTLEDCDKYIAAIRELEIKPSILNHKFHNLKKLKFIVNDDVQSIHYEIFEITPILERNNLQAWRRVKALLLDLDASVEDYDDLAINIMEIAKKSQERINKIKELNERLNDYSENLNDYFTISK